MASTAGSIANTVQVRSAETSNATPQSHRGPRNRNRRNGNQEGKRDGNQSRQTSTPQQSRGKSGRSRGRGDFGMHELNLNDQNESRKAGSSPQPGPSLDLPPGPGDTGTYGDRLTIDATHATGEMLAKDDQGEGSEVEEVDICFICTSSVVHGSVAPCNHRTCHICALRMRALYKTTACAHCRVSFAPASYIKMEIWSWETLC